MPNTPARRGTSDAELGAKILAGWERMSRAVPDGPRYNRRLAEHFGVAVREVEHVRDIRNRVAHPDEPIRRPELEQALAIIRRATRAGTRATRERKPARAAGKATKSRPSTKPRSAAKSGRATKSRPGTRSGGKAGKGRSARAGTKARPGPDWAHYVAWVFILIVILGAVVAALVS